MDKQRVLARLRQFEGAAPHMYRCTGGEVTIGIGHALPNAAAAERLGWQIEGRAASPEEVSADYAKVAAAPKGQVASSYSSLTQCRLSNDRVNQLADSDITHFETQLASILPGWNSFPEPAQEALFDMGFNLGIRGLEKFVKMLAAVNAGDWETAAEECTRSGISGARNQATAALFRQAKAA
jgi:GH24 family phage-related lysozyme (muramidase)